MAKPLPGNDVPLIDRITGMVAQAWYEYFQSPTIKSSLTVGNKGASAPAGSVGEIIRNVIPVSPGFSLTSGSTGQVWNSINLTAGAWIVGCQSGVFGSAGATFTHMHADHGLGTTSIQTSPGDGTTTALHLTSNNSNGWIFPNGIKPYYLTAPATINAVMTADFSGGTAVAYGTLWAMRIA